MARVKLRALCLHTDVGREHELLIRLLFRGLADIPHDYAKKCICNFYALFADLANLNDICAIMNQEDAISYDSPDYLRQRHIIPDDLIQFIVGIGPLAKKLRAEN